MAGTNETYLAFADDFAKRLEQQTGLTLGQYAALILAGQNPSAPSAVSEVSKKLRKRLASGKRIRKKDIRALLDMVDDYLEFQELGPKDRVTFGRQVLQKIVPVLSAANLDSLSLDSVSKIRVSDELRGDIVELLKGL